MIKASRINHRGEERLKLDFPYNIQIINLIKQIKHAAWSQTLKAWHVPYSKEALIEFKLLFPDIELPAESAVADRHVEGGAIARIEKVSNNKDQNSRADRNRITLEVIGKKIILKMPKNDADIKFICALKYSRWDGSMFCWEIPNYPGNLDRIRDYFNDRIDELVMHEKFDVSIHNETHTIGCDELLIVKTRTGRLRLIFGYQNDLRLLIKTFPYCSWDAKNKWWTIPFSDIFLNQLQAKALESGMNVYFQDYAYIRLPNVNAIII